MYLSILVNCALTNQPSPAQPSQPAQLCEGPNF